VFELVSGEDLMSSRVPIPYSFLVSLLSWDKSGPSFAPKLVTPLPTPHNKDLTYTVYCGNITFYYYMV